jgi:predicted nucleic acid-binding protein
MMKVILDTNILLDFIKVREFHREAGEILDLALERKFHAFICAHQVTTLAYYLEKSARSPQEFRQRLTSLLSFIDVLPVNRDRINEALISELKDFEDAVVESAAFAINADYIVTRNIKDFSRSRMKAVTPAQFLNLLSHSETGGFLIREDKPDYHSRPRRRHTTKAKPTSEPKQKKVGEKTKKV